MEHEAIMREAVVSREPPTSPDGAEHEWQIEARAGKWFVEERRIAAMCWRSRSHKVNFTWV